MITVAEALRDSPISVKDSVWLLSSLLGIGQAELYLRSFESLPPPMQKKFHRAVKLRENGQPMQYILGKSFFWGREFKVSPGVLIPRPETEQLVEWIFQKKLLTRGQSSNVFEVGVGSGCIAITLAKEEPAWRVSGSETSAKARRIARMNAKTHGVKIALFGSAFLDAALRGRGERLDLVVSNPPYLDPKKDFIAADVKAWEPKEALISKDSGAWHAEQIFAQCLLLLPRHLILELSARVASRLERIWRKHPSVRHVERLADLNGRKRFLLVDFRNG